MISMAHLCLSMGMEIELELLYCAPFRHGVGDKCVDARPTLASWTLHSHDEEDSEFSTRYYDVDGTCPILICLDVLVQCNIFGDMNKSEAPASVISNSVPLPLPTVHTGKDLSTRVWILLVPSNFISVKSMLADHEKLRRARTLMENEERFATPFLLYTHFTLKDMRRICARAVALTRTLDQLPSDAFSAYRTCASRGTPLASRKVSFFRLMKDLKHHVLIDFMPSDNAR